MEVAATAERDAEDFGPRLSLRYSSIPKRIPRASGVMHFHISIADMGPCRITVWRQNILGVVPAYIDLIVQWARTSAKVESGEAIKSLYSLPPSIARDKAIAGRLIRFFNSIASAEEETQRARMHVESDRVLRDLDAFVANRKAGGAVMDFEFVDEQGSLVTWKDFKEKWWC